MPPVPPKNAGPVRDAHRFDEARLDAWMADNVEGYTGLASGVSVQGWAVQPYVLARRSRAAVRASKEATGEGCCSRRTWSTASFA